MEGHLTPTMLLTSSSILEASPLSSSTSSGSAKQGALLAGKLNINLRSTSASTRVGHVLAVTWLYSPFAQEKGTPPSPPRRDSPMAGMASPMSLRSGSHTSKLIKKRRFVTTLAETDEAKCKVFLCSLLMYLVAWLLSFTVLGAAASLPCCLDGYEPTKSKPPAKAASCRASPHEGDSSTDDHDPDLKPWLNMAGRRTPQFCMNSLPTSKKLRRLPHFTRVPLTLKHLAEASDCHTLCWCPRVPRSMSVVKFQLKQMPS
jgi:hypothetical protein